MPEGIERNGDVGVGGNWGEGSQLLKLGRMGEDMRGGWRDPRTRLTRSRAAQYEQGGWRWMTLARSPHKAVKVAAVPVWWLGRGGRRRGGEESWMQIGCIMHVDTSRASDGCACRPASQGFRVTAISPNAASPPANSAGGDDEMQTRMTLTSRERQLKPQLNSHRWRRWESGLLRPAGEDWGRGSTISTGPETSPSWRQVCWIRRDGPPPQLPRSGWLHIF